jgi:hypothetical protein
MSETEFNDLYGSKYLGADDLNGSIKRVQIGKTDIADFKQKDGTSQKKYVVFFKGEKKALVLNKTNAKELAKAYGKNRADWIDNFIELYSAETTFGEGIRVRPLCKPATPDKPDPDLDDFIPF